MLAMEALRDTHTLPALPEDFTWSRTAAGVLLTCKPLAQVARHAWSTRQLELQGPEAACGAQWMRVAESMSVAADAVRRMHQVHGTTVLPANAEVRTAPAADGLISDDSSLLLCVRVADCVPVLLGDRRTGAVAAVHAGWRGTAAGIVGVAVRAMQHRYGTALDDIEAALGPSIGPCHYEIGPEVRAAFRSEGWDQLQLARWFRPGRDRLRLDIASANADQLCRAGVHADSIHVSGLCTACHPEWFYSYRRDGPGTGRLVGCIRARERSAEIGAP